MLSDKEILKTSIEYLKGVGPRRAELLKSELGIATMEDLLYHFPFRYVDRTSVISIFEAIDDGLQVQLKCTITDKSIIRGANNRKRLHAKASDGTGIIELIWFQGLNWIEPLIEPGNEYIIFGKLETGFGTKKIIHPEIEPVSDRNIESKTIFSPVYNTTEKLNSAGLNSRGIARLIENLLFKLQLTELEEILPEHIKINAKLISRKKALYQIHFPRDIKQLKEAQLTLKFEELFMLQLRLLFSKYTRKKKIKGFIFDKVGSYFNEFYSKKLKFELTEAQKRVTKNIRSDLRSGIQMNRLLQGDVGSGKTIVALMTMLIAIDNGYQACMMAPTEILAQQHFNSLSEMLKGLGINIGFLTGSVKGNVRKSILAALEQGYVHILVGTHALIEPSVKFNNLGLVIIDEQHRFGVKQRAALWHKSKPSPPHILVMTATPIPRTLSMTLYGDLDVSVIDELPPGRKHVNTVHLYESKRFKVIKFIEDQITLGRQIYVVYPLIEESEKLDLKNLQDGYENMLHHFPRPKYQMSIVHGKMKPVDKDFEMQRFKEGRTQILISTTVIEVGVDVPNASVMVIENAERFGLSQLHQLRGRVGRGAEQSYCILMSSYKLTAEAKERLQTMVRTNNGFEISEVDMRLRGPGDIEGLRQSGLLDLKISNLIQDEKIISFARKICENLLDNDPNIEKAENISLRKYIIKNKNLFTGWGRIS
ncbi:MAG: ATP-dependent DNA helicase RecG [Deltaproteobacteria bacterium]